ncbi:LysR family transcriptional regulator [Gluconobacter kanchanaburiensis]|uniref:LysR family transcriptional regulator n=1 Tax=Gluconobacter kanchanaburiensis NBRC 103587 TaxID=1307948 RepID=A0A511B939_9PROT|nr:LysR family transcriptional regulator [Gluconobacter kanchanaburiensis]MBF0862689.1 LysR family transcriptional regulator [Gluconobacter kanchanaburiensis]GBR67483.1 transcriptional regulator [Gluconobacter kanchanaburiensis NBRC 103587]GEK96939.1 LysR family transcriptional regulator [Gluconobacter kanchanaburiensis NBRC 103587]
MIELRHLHAVVAIAEERNLTRAAERLGIQQPPLTRLLRGMEQELGVQLFERHARGMRLTTAGRSMLKGAYDVIARMNETVEDVRRIVRGEAGELSIGFTNSALCHPSLPDMLGQFRETWPDVGLTLTEGNSSQLLEALRDDTVDVAFVRTSIPYVSDVMVELIVEEPMVVAVPRTHPLANKALTEGIRLTELENEDFILYQSQYNNGLYKTIVDACLGAGFTPRIRQKGPQLLAALNLVAGGLGLSLVPQSMQQHHAGQIAYLPLSSRTALTAPLYLVFRSVRMTGAKLYFIHQARRIRQTYGPGKAQ